MTEISLRPLPAEEAIRYFKAKGYKTSFDYRDIEPQEHQAAFTVARCASVDILSDIRAAVDDALANGQSLGEFAKNLTPTLQDKGWWGRQQAVDPLTGETVDVQLGCPRRLKTIYATNMRRAYSEGQWDRVQDSAEDLPYLQYHGGQSHHPRAVHLAWDKMVVRVTDPWVKLHYPIKEWGCKCLMTQLSEAMVKARGLTVVDGPAERAQEYVNPRTGSRMMVPAGVDPAFNYPIGEGRPKLTQVLTAKLNRADPAIARNTVAAIVDSPEFRGWYDALAPKPTAGQVSAGEFQVAILRAELREAIGAKAQTVVMSDVTAAKQKLHHPEIRAEEYRHVQKVVDYGDSFQEADNTLVFMLDEPDGFVAVVKAAKAGEELYLQSYRRVSRDDAVREKQKAKLLRRSQRGE
jgi:hypothetical protein